jgi:hypothetical protein
MYFNFGLQLVLPLFAWFWHPLRMQLLWFLVSFLPLIYLRLCEPHSGEPAIVPLAFFLSLTMRGRETRLVRPFAGL